MKSVKITNALLQLRHKHNGLLLPETVVEAARPANSVLHSRFEWKDGVAAELYRLQQARQLIAVNVSVLPGTETKFRTFVSLSTERGKGYRTVVEVLSHAQMREQLLQDALHDLNTLQHKYRQLRELSEVFAAIQSVKSRKKAA